MQNERNRKTFEEITEQINRDNTIYVNRPIAHAVGAYAAIVFNALIGKYILLQAEKYAGQGWLVLLDYKGYEGKHYAVTLSSG